MFRPNPQPGEQVLQRLEDDRRLDVAGVVDRVDRRAVPLDVPGAPDRIADAAQREAELYAAMAGAIEDRRVAERERQHDAWRADEQNVEAHRNVCGKRADRSDESTHGSSGAR